MKAIQPKLKFLVNTGDNNPIEYGGRFVFIDETGNYDPVVFVLIPGAGDGSPNTWEVGMYKLPSMTYRDGVLLERNGNSVDPVWFSDNLQKIAASNNHPPDLLVEWLCADDPVERALGWECVENYYGFCELSLEYHLMTSVSEVVKWMTEIGVTLLQNVYPSKHFEYVLVEEGDWQRLEYQGVSDACEGRRPHLLAKTGKAARYMLSAKFFDGDCGRPGVIKVDDVWVGAIRFKTIAGQGALVDILEQLDSIVDTLET